MLFYNLVTRCYFLIIYLASPFNSKAKLWIEGRKDLLNSIKKSLENDERRIWVHCASLGEFEQGRPVIERLKKEYPEHKIVLTFFSPSGYEIRNFIQDFSIKTSIPFKKQLPFPEVCRDHIQWNIIIL